MTLLLLIVALQADVSSATQEIKLPPPSSSQAPVVQPQFDDLVFRRDKRVPIDILYRIPVADAEAIADQIRSGVDVYMSYGPWLG